MIDYGYADMRLISFYSIEYGKYVDALEAGRKDEAAIRKIRCDALRDLIGIEAREGPDMTERKARAFDILNDTLFGYGDVLLIAGKNPRLVINNESGTEISITDAAAKAMLEAGIPEYVD